MPFARFILSVVALAMALTAQAQVYPAKPIRLIVPYPAGGGTDFFARAVGAQLSAQLGQPVVVENRPGAATMIGAEAVAKSAPDGYTVLLGDTATFAVNTSLYKKLPYDPDKDLALVTMTGRFALLLVVNPSKLKAGSVKELVETTKQGVGQDRLRLARTGQPAPLGDGNVQAAYRGAVHPCPLQGFRAGDPGPARRPDSADVSRPRGRRAADQGRQNKSAGGLASDKRIAALPDLPTVSEAGVAGFEAWAWQALAVPVATPKEIVARLNAEYRKAIAVPELRQKLIEAGIDPLESSPENASAYARSETLKWAKVISEGKITVE